MTMTGGTYTWTTKHGETASGSEDSFLAAIERGEVDGIECDAASGLYSWREANG